MKSKYTTCLLLSVVLLVTAVYAQREFRVGQGSDAQNDENRGKQWALLVGIDAYDDPTISQLRYCVADVKAFYGALTDPSLGGFDKDQVYLMTGNDTGRTRPSNTNVIVRLEKLAELVKPEDTFVFYFSGHGMTREEKPFLLSINADARTLTSLELSAIPLEKVKRILSSIKAHQTLIILDACRNDPASGRGDEDNPLTEAFARGIQVRPKLSRAGLPAVTATLYACSLGERAYEYPEKGQGVFSYFLLEGLKGNAAAPNGLVTIASLAKYTQQHVAKWARENLHGGKKQTPWLAQEGGAELVLARVQVEVDDAVEELSSLATLEVNSNPSGATVYVDGVPHGVTPARIPVDTGVTGKKTVVVALALEGYATKRGRLKLQAGRRAPWNVTLERLPAPPAPPREETLPPQGQTTPTKYITGKDGVKMALIPAGEFQMGSNDGRDIEKPVHTVYVDAFYMDVYEVTNAQYRKFVQATGHREPIGWGYVDGKWKDGFEPWKDSRFNGDNQPIVCVSWDDAVAYCAWAGKRLPTEAEWERAARGGLAGKRYPWGDSIDKSQANYNRNVGKPTPVGRYEPNRYGLYDMVGNAWEWCADWYGSDYYKNSPKRNPTGPNSGSWRVLRGGSWYNDFASWVVCAVRYHSRPFNGHGYGGFRGVQSASP